MSITNLIEALKQAGLTAEQERILTWIKTVAQASDINPEQIQENLLKMLSQAKPPQLSQESYLQYLFSATMGELSSGLFVEFTPVGSYRTSGTSNAINCDTLCQFNIDDRLSHLLIIAKGERNLQKVRGLSLSKKYRLNTSIKNFCEGGYKAWLNDSSTFTEVGLLKETEEEILKPYPSLSLSDVENNMSRFEPGSKEFVNKIDVKLLKEIYLAKVTIGEGWALLGITDITFIPTHQQPLFPAWVDPVVLQKAGAIEGSFVNLFGTIELDNNGRLCMQVCRIQPIVKKPFVEPSQRVLKISME